MRRIRVLTGPIVLGALLATTPQLAGQRAPGEKMATVEGLNLTWSVRPGTEIQGDQLGEFLADNIMLDLSEEAYPVRRLAPGVTPTFRVALGLEMISRREGVIETYESHAVEVEPGKTYPVSTWIPIPRRFTYGQGGRLTLGEFGTFGDIGEAWRAPECEGATHAVRITLASDDDALVKNPTKYLCLTAEG